MNIKLVRPTAELKKQAIDFRQEFFDHDEMIINGSELLDKTDDYDEWLKAVTANTKIETVNPNWVVTDTFFAVDETNRIIGIIANVGMNELHLSVERDNEPSVKTIKYNGGIYERSFRFEGEDADIYKIAL